ncbi:MAG: aspartate aminotransferase family protein [Planctomycetes bacterium]|nr:aspartate aminotransferase family protein [Planctomycetota bacterium]
MDAEEFRRAGHRLIDWLADYRAHVAHGPVSQPVEPGSLRAQLPANAPEQPESFDAVFADFERVLAPGLVHWQHPSFHGYFPSNAELSSVLGDLLSTGVGSLGLAWQSNPALTELEDLTLDWMRRALGLSDAWRGVIQDTASSATLVALVCARERSTRCSFAHGGLQAEPKPLVVYVSLHSHSSVEKAALLAGFGRDNVRAVGVDAHYALDPAQLARAMADDRAAGRMPCAIVGTSGTTTTTAFDPLDALGELAREHRAWLHVDAAMAGSAMLVPRLRELWRGVEAADSLVLNPHKWLGAAFDCSLYYVRDAEHLVRVMSTRPSYLATAFDERARNLRDWGIPLGRRFRALKLWFLLRDQGLVRLRARLERDLDNAQWLAGEVRAAPQWRVLAPVALQTVCVRHEPDGLAGEALDAHTQRWAERLNRSGLAYVTPAVLDGRWMVRLSIGALDTERRHVEELWRNVRTAAEGGALAPRAD